MKLNPNIELQPLDDKLIILDLEHNAYYNLNGTARFFIEKTAQSLTFDQIIEAALQEYDTDREQLVKDFKQLQDELVKMELIKN